MLVVGGIDDLLGVLSVPCVQDLQEEIRVSVVAGKRDQMTQLKAGQAMAKAIPEVRFVALDAGHSMMSEAPRELLRVSPLAVTLYTSGRRVLYL